MEVKNIPVFFFLHSLEVCLQLTNRYYKIPHIGRFSAVAQTKLRHLVNYYCTDLDFKLAFSTFKVRHFFNVKDSNCNEPFYS